MSVKGVMFCAWILYDFIFYISESLHVARLGDLLQLYKSLTETVLNVEMFSNLITAAGDRLVCVCAKRGILIVLVVDQFINSQY
jgi:hypothetical protein